MFFNSVPSDERFNSSASNTLRSHSAGSDARRPYPFSERLARIYDRFIEKHGDNLEVIGIAGCGAVPSALVFALAVEHGPFWAITTTACSIGFYAAAMISVINLRDKIRDQAKRIAEIEDGALWRRCESRRERIDALMTENDHLKQDVAHLQESLSAQRGSTYTAERAAAENLSCSDKQEGSAAVVEFPKGAGA